MLLHCWGSNMETFDSYIYICVKKEKEKVVIYHFSYELSLCINVVCGNFWLLSCWGGRGEVEVFIANGSLITEWV
jgi:hypothetical protein